jgi:putative transposase
MRKHLRLCLSIPPKYSVSHVVGFLKGKGAVQIHRDLLHERRMAGLHSWATGYYVSTVGRAEASMHQSIRDQEERDHQQGQSFE